MCGFRATNEDNSPLPEIYVMGIIDILQPYSARKRIEHSMKGLRYDPV
jgi:1-phosphatidylinositol-4-phosphate 5-kinase